MTLFGGSRFDSRNPSNDFGAFALNRAGETGYNDPALGIYRAARRGGIGFLGKA